MAFILLSMQKKKMNHQLKIALFLFSLLCLPTLGFAQKQGKWEESVVYSSLILENTWTAHTLRSGGGVTEAKVTGPKRAIVKGFKFSGAYYYLENVQFGFEYSRNKVDVEGKYSRVDLVGAGVPAPIDENFKLAYNFTSTTLFARRILPYGMYVQVGKVWRDWSLKRRYNFARYDIYWPTDAYQVVAGVRWVSTFGLVVNASLDTYIGARPRIEIKRTSANYYANTFFDALDKSMKDGLNKQKIVYGFTVDFGYSLSN